MEKGTPFSHAYQRKEVIVDLTDHDRDPVDNARPVAKEGEGNLYSSELVNFHGMHAPTLDIDMEVFCIESTTPGHYHLYIDHAMRWNDYVLLLNTLAKVGILQRGYVDLSIARRASYLRKPGVEKTPDDWPDS